MMKAHVTKLNTYTTYGTITRGGAVGHTLDSIPVNVGGTIELPTLEETYAAACFGTIEPNIGVTTALGYSYIKEKFQTQQRSTIGALAQLPLTIQ